MYGFLRQSTAATVLAGPFLSPSDGVTPATGLSAPASAASGATSGVALVTGGVSAGYTPSGWAHDRLGYYTVNLSTGDTGTAGRLRLEFADAANYAPVHMDLIVLSGPVYDWLFGPTAPYTGTPPTAAAIAAATWQDATAGDFTATGSIGKLLVTGPPGWYATPPTASQVAAAILVTPGNLLATDGSGHALLSLTQPIPTSNTIQTVGDALNAARAQGFGGWNITGTTWVIYAGDGVTPVRTFTLNSATTPTSRT